MNYLTIDWLIAVLAFLSAVLNYYQALKHQKRADKLNGELIDLRADFSSYKAMYGPNLMTVMPDVHGSASHAVLIDLFGRRNQADFCIGHYNWNDSRWTFTDPINEDEYKDVMKYGRWYRLPLPKYETQRNSIIAN
jgi:hypothetical protein